MNERFDPRTWSLSIWTLISAGIFFVTCLGAGLVYSQHAEGAHYTLLQGLQNCAQNTDGATPLIACTRQLVESQLGTHTPKELMDEVSSAHVPQAYGDCHSIAHVIGAETYRRYKNVETALSYCSDECFSGCLHGVLGEAVVEEQGAGSSDADIAHMDVAQIETVGAKYCKNIFDLDICHGIGHILYSVLGDFKKATDACGSMAQGIFADACASGVFMQGAGGVRDTITLGSSVPAVASVPDGDYGYPCDTLSAQYQHACLIYLPEYQQIALAKAGVQAASSKLRTATRTCMALGQPLRSYCFEGIGKYLPYFIDRSATTSEVMRVCDDLPAESDRESCEAEHVRVLKGFGRNDEALAYCKAERSKMLQDQCMTAYFSR